MDGLFSSENQAVRFTQEFEALYTNGPAGGGGISIGHKKEILLEKVLVPREVVFWQTCTKVAKFPSSKGIARGSIEKSSDDSFEGSVLYSDTSSSNVSANPEAKSSHKLAIDSRVSLPAPGGVRIPLYKVAHSRTGDKGNNLNFSIIPHCPADISRLKGIITAEWVKKIMRNLFICGKVLGDISTRSLDDTGNFHCFKTQGSGGDMHVEIYEVQGIQALNIVIRNVLDGGVNCSRRIDRHGKSLSDLVLCQMITLPLEKNDY